MLKLADLSFGVCSSGSTIVTSTLTATESLTFSTTCAIDFLLYFLERGSYNFTAIVNLSSFSNTSIFVPIKRSLSPKFK